MRCLTKQKNLEGKDTGGKHMKRCSECLEECEYYADEVAELCERCASERDN
jgi:hypothetical protein